MHQRLWKLTIHDNTLHSMWWKYSVDPQDDHFCQSAQSLRSSGTLDQRIARRSESSRKTWCRWSDGTRNSHSISYCRRPSQWWATGKPVAKIWAKFWKTTRRPEVIQICAPKQVWTWSNRTILLCFSVSEWTKESIFMPRIHITSRWRANMCERVDPKQCKNRTRLGHKSFQISRKIRNWSWSFIIVRGSDYILDQNGERRWKVRQRSNASPRGRKSFGETHCKGKTNTETVIDKRMELYSSGTKKMDRHWSEKIQRPLLLPDVIIHQEFTTTQKCLTRRRCRSPHCQYWRMQESPIRRFEILDGRNKTDSPHGAVLVSEQVDGSSDKRWWK